MAEKEHCPHCDTPYYPVWTLNSLTSPTPDRQESAEIGKITATTCTSCDSPILNLILTGWGGEELAEDRRDQEPKAQQIFPPEPEMVIEIIVQIFIDFENVRRQEHREPEMTDHEEETMKNSYTEFFLSVLEGARLARGTARVLERFQLFFEQIQKLLPPSE